MTQICVTETIVKNEKFIFSYERFKFEKKKSGRYQILILAHVFLIDKLTTSTKLLFGLYPIILLTKILLMGPLSLVISYLKSYIYHSRHIIYHFIKFIKCHIP